MSRIVYAIVAGGMMAAAVMASARPVFLGPANSGAESGFDAWYYGVLGGGLAAIDHDDPATGSSDFKIGINDAASYPTNHADIRSTLFPLESAGKRHTPITFSFAYKLLGEVKPGDNIEVCLRFFNEQGNFLGQKIYRVGSSTHDSEMLRYKTKTVTKIFAPPKATQADVWIVANIFTPWTSGNAQFDDFSVTVPGATPWAQIFVGLGILAALAAVWLFLRRYARQRHERQTTGVSTHPLFQRDWQRMAWIKKKSVRVAGACVLAAGMAFGLMLFICASKTIKIKTYIDGADTVKIQGRKIWYEHESFALPGDNDKPTMINDKPWFPKWDDKISDAYDGLKPPFAPRSPDEIKLTKLTGRGEVKINELPSPQNNQTLAIHFSDDPPGADWYEVTIEWR